MTSTSREHTHTVLIPLPPSIAPGATRPPSRPPVSDRGSAVGILFAFCLIFHIQFPLDSPQPFLPFLCCYPISPHSLSFRLFQKSPAPQEGLSGNNGMLHILKGGVSEVGICTCQNLGSCELKVCALHCMRIIPQLFTKGKTSKNIRKQYYSCKSPLKLGKALARQLSWLQHCPNITELQV